MKIAFIGFHDGPYVKEWHWGQEKAMMRLARALAKKGHHIDIYSIDGRGIKMIDEHNIRFFYVNQGRYKIFRIFHYYGNVSKILREQEYDILHFCHPIAGLFRYRQKKIVHFHTVPESYENILSLLNIRFNLYVHLGRIGLKSFDHALCNSTYVKDKIKEVSKDIDISVIPNPVCDISGHKKNGRRGILYAGRIVPEKGLSSLLEAVSRIGDVRLRIAGRRLSSRYRWRSDIDKLLKNAIMLGDLEEEELISEYKKTKVFCYPSSCEESFGLAAYEAYMCGCIIVATRTGGLPELFEGSKNVFFCDEYNMKDVLKHALSKIYVPEPVFKKSLKEKLSAENVAKRYIEIILR